MPWGRLCSAVLEMVTVDCLPANNFSLEVASLSGIARSREDDLHMVKRHSMCFFSRALLGGTDNLSPRSEVNGNYFISIQ
mmetsp:Transcript_16622/g.52953  ORF Transcript_16622/g.52953 Transcript_16622/m.52953 type:complete len:80 (-) Transcript_16622:40-279(-)